MLPPPFDNVLILSGPTASGKTQLGLELAEHLGGEIVSVDSMALYRRMDIGTAKPTAAERERVRHHLVDVLEPWESASVAWWLAQAAAACQEIAQRGKRALLVGGTPLYLKAVVSGLFEGPPADDAIRQQLADELAALGPDGLHRKLVKVDPASAQRLHPNDTRRVIRALEVWQLTGKPLSAWQTQWPQAPLPRPHQALWLDPPRAELYAAIDKRVDAMFAAGLVEETRILLGLPNALGKEARQALGYKEVIDHLEGKLSEDEARIRVATRTRNFAKRQITWFRHLPGFEPATRQLTRELWASTI